MSTLTGKSDKGSTFGTFSTPVCTLQDVSAKEVPQKTDRGLRRWKYVASLEDTI